MSLEYDSADYLARAKFRDRMFHEGMDVDTANYCISIAKRLRDAYAHDSPTEVEEREAAALVVLQNALDKIVTYDVDGIAARWTCIPGGLHEGDKTELYIVPPGREPIAVPLPQEQKVRAAQAYAAHEKIRQALTAAARDSGWRDALIESPQFMSLVKSVTDTWDSDQCGDVAGSAHHKVRSDMLLRELQG